jgi:hypothetical protein
MRMCVSFIKPMRAYPASLEARELYLISEFDHTLSVD